MKSRILLMLITVILIGGTSSLLAQMPYDSTSIVWVSFGGYTSTINGELMPTGTLIDAYSPKGVHCGHQVASAPGKYPFLAAYGYDADSPNSGDYCVSGDHVTFTINGKVAYELGPDDDVWSGHGDRKVLNLAISDITEFSVALVAPDSGIGEPDSTVIYHVTVTNDGNGVDLIALDVASWRGWTVTGQDSAGKYYNAGEDKDLELSVTIPHGTSLGTQDTLFVTARSRFDPTARAADKIITICDKQTGVDDTPFAVPGLFSLDQNFPNPFNPETIVSFNLEKAGEVTLAIYDVLGRKVTTLCQGLLEAGRHEYRWFGTDERNVPVASGIYFYRLSAEQTNLTRKMVLLK